MGLLSDWLTLHTVATYAVRAAVKAELSQQSVSLSLQLTRVKTMLKLFWPLLRHSTTVDKLCWNMAKNMNT